MHPKDAKAIHASTAHPRHTAVKVVRWVYVFLIVGVIGGMLFFNGLDFLKDLRRSYNKHKQEGAVERMNLDMRIQHWVLMGSFVLLLFTGFAIKFPTAFWVTPFANLSHFWLVRFYLHRVAGVVFVLLCFYHLFFIFFKRRGRREFKALLPGLGDVKDALHMLFYYLGYKSQPARFGRYSFGEKAEYWALVWGAVVMSATGFVLWFYSQALSIWPKWVFDLCELIHYMEAILAGLAILVWHGYHVIFGPKAYPVNWTCLTGRMSEQDYQEEHPLDTAR